MPKATPEPPRIYTRSKGRPSALRNPGRQQKRTRVQRGSTREAGSDGTTDGSISGMFKVANIKHDAAARVMQQVEPAMRPRVETAPVKCIVHYIEQCGARAVPPKACVYCNAHIPGNRGLDELVPCTKHGRWNALNRVPCCASCNASKGNREGGAFKDWLVAKCNRVSKRRRALIWQYYTTFAQWLRSNDSSTHSLLLDITAVCDHFHAHMDREVACISRIHKILASNK